MPKVVVASKNPAKVSAVTEILLEYPNLAGFEVEARETDSGVGDQPRSLEETIRGARARAEKAFAASPCEYAFGIESGVNQVPHTKSGYMDVCCVSIYDGKEHYLGLSSMFEFPNPEVMRMIVEEGMNMSDAVKKAGMTESENIGWKEGAIGLLTKGRMNRKEYTKQALRTALIHLDN